MTGRHRQVRRLRIGDGDRRERSCRPAAERVVGLPAAALEVADQHHFAARQRAIRRARCCASFNAGRVARGPGADRAPRRSAAEDARSPASTRTSSSALVRRQHQRDAVVGRRAPATVRRAAGCARSQRSPYPCCRSDRAAPPPRARRLRAAASDRPAQERPRERRTISAIAASAQRQQQPVADAPAPHRLVRNLAAGTSATGTRRPASARAGSGG